MKSKKVIHCKKIRINTNYDGRAWCVIRGNKEDHPRLGQLKNNEKIETSTVLDFNFIGKTAHVKTKSGTIYSCPSERLELL